MTKNYIHLQVISFCHTSLGNADVVVNLHLQHNNNQNICMLS
jgi:hypothetical protein